MTTSAAQNTATTTTTGYDDDFLPARVTLPRPLDDRELRDLAYTHFSVLLDPVRRLAVSTGVNIDGALLRDLDRGDDWHFDPRIPETEQTGPAVYANNDLDRGHQVRRRDPVWGDNTTATTANFDTFAFTNAAPQAAEFNQSEELWAGLEDYILGHARLYANRLSVFTAPVLAADDAPYRGILLPKMFWKIAVWSPSAEGDASGAALAATGYILDQTPELSNIDLLTARAVAAGEIPPLGPFKTYQVPIADIGTMAGLDVAALAEVDRFHLDDTEPQPAGGMRAHWHLLDSMEQVEL